MGRVNSATTTTDLSSYDKSANLEKAERYCREAARNGAGIITLPEMFNWMGPFSETKKVAETKDGPAITMLRSIAHESGCYIVAGSILERQNKGLPLNTTFFVGRKGEIISRYSKMHLFDLEIPGEIEYLESKAMAAGRNLAVAKTPFGKVGFVICNVLRYPEAFRKLTLAGCKIIFNSSAFTERTGKEHWHGLNRVRAFENLIYIVSTNQSGHNADGVKYYGHSMVVDPWGKIVTEGPPDGDVILYADIDLSKVD
ncbi:MAG: carbon-nitrogen hydrolase family protein, partial [Proteobacteria bacterium]|nr:carbon-nitrogen hydrolase family protein [Pseudomonadota bacterium]